MQFCTAILLPHLPPKLPLPVDQSPNHLPHPWTHLNYHLKPHPYMISLFTTMLRTVRHRPTNIWLEGMFDDNRPLSLYAGLRDLIMLTTLWFRKKRTPAIFLTNFNTYWSIATILVDKIYKKPAMFTCIA